MNWNICKTKNSQNLSHLAKMLNLNLDIRMKNVNERGGRLQYFQNCERLKSSAKEVVTKKSRLQARGPPVKEQYQGQCTRYNKAYRNVSQLAKCKRKRKEK